MVVTRRTPAPPVPTSRTNSAQPIPRAKGKAPHTVPDVPSPLANGVSRAEPVFGTDGSGPDYAEEVDVSWKKGKGRQKGKQKKDKHKKSKRNTGFVELLTRIFLVWFTVYTLSVCPTDDKHESPVCRGLYEYRKHVLEPYLLPPIQHALSHPAVAPYVDRAKPIVNRVITTATPVVLCAHHEWSTKVVPQWDKTVVPQWQKHVVPQWKRHVAPHAKRVEQQLEPYLFKAQSEYERRLGPHVRLAMYKLHKWQQQARPYIVLAAHKTYDGYQRTKPYAVPLLQRAQLLLVKVSQFLGEQRRQFVDPHVKKIWERVNELSHGEIRPEADIREKFTASASRTTSVLSSIAVPETPATLSSATPVHSIVSLESETDSTTVPFTDPSATQNSVVPTSEVVVAPQDGASAAAHLASCVTEEMATLATSFGSAASSMVLVSEDAPSASSSVQEAHTLSSVSAELGSLASSASDAASAVLSHGSALVQQSIVSPSSTASIVIDENSSSATPLVSTASETASQIPDAPSAISSQDTEDAEDDDFLAKFYAELGLDGDLLAEHEDASESEAASPAAETETEEEKAAKLRLRKEETIQKRAAITARHADWEKQIEDRVTQNRKALRKTLVAMRKAAVQELKENADIHAEVEGLVEEAEKYLRGAEKYMSTLKRESRSHEEKRTIWDRVTEKVDKKFEERLLQTETIVNGWYLKVVEQEVAEVRRLALQVKEIADRAQADIGLDYAWLDDVTYEDWQRYHELERKSEQFTAQAFTIQNGTHPSPPVNPVLPAIQDLQNEVQDIIIGFETRLRRIKRNGERAFGATPEDSDAPSDETVSILPIEDDSHEDLKEDDSPAVPPVVIGRSKEEILSALARAAEFEAQATSAPQGNHVEPEQVVESLAEEAVAEGYLTSSPVKSHDEL